MLTRGLQTDFVLELDLLQFDALMETLLRQHYQDVIDETTRMLAAVCSPWHQKGKGEDPVTKVLKPYRDWLRKTNTNKKPKKVNPKGLAAAMAKLK